MKIFSWWREFLYLRKSDRMTILALLCVIVVGLGVIGLTGGRQDATEGLTAADSLANDSAKRKTARSGYRQGYHRVDTIYLRPTYYRNRRPSAKTQSREGRTVQDAFDSADTLHRYQPRPHKIGEGEFVDLATADTTALMTVPGIGSYYARKIVQYGERLGGYVSVAQLDEIDNFPQDAKRYLTIDGTAVRKLNINKLSLNELRRHPYINFYQARAITDYRRLHGPIASLSDLGLSRDFPPEAIERLAPYVEY